MFIHQKTLETSKNIMTIEDSIMYYYFKGNLDKAFRFSLFFLLISLMSY